MFSNSYFLNYEFKLQFVPFAHRNVAHKSMGLYCVISLCYFAWYFDLLFNSDTFYMTLI